MKEELYNINFFPSPCKFMTNGEQKLILKCRRPIKILLSSENFSKKIKGASTSAQSSCTPFPLGTRPRAAQETNLEINLKSVHVCVKSEKHLSTCFLPGGQKRSKTRHLQGGWWGYVDLVMIGIQALGIWPWRARSGGLPSRLSEHINVETGTRGQQAWQGVSTVCMTRSQKNSGEQIGATLK